MDNGFLISFLLALIILLTFYIFFDKLRQRDAFKGRIKDLTRHQKDLEQQKALKAFKTSITTNNKLLGWFLDYVQKISSTQKETIQIKFEKAGLSSNNAVLFYICFKIISMLSSVFLTFFALLFYKDLSSTMKIILMCAGLFIGYFVVDGVLDYKSGKRAKKIEAAFPDALDLMIICVESGLGLNATIQKVAQEISFISPDLAYELALLNIELTLLTDRQKAFDNFMKKMSSENLVGIISNLAQAEKYGTPIAQTMKVLAEEFRQSRLLKAEERAARIPALITVPMILFILPVIFIVILGPAIITTLEVFK